MIALASKVENYEADLALFLLKANFHNIADFGRIVLTEKIDDKRPFEKYG